MAKSLSLITAPAVEPVVIDDVLPDLGYPVSSGLDEATLAVITARVTPKIIAARSFVEGYLRLALITQTLQLTMDGFPGQDRRYNRCGYHEIVLPRPPFQSIVSFHYVDMNGTLQSLTEDTTYGNSTSLQYTYQLATGGERAAARLTPSFGRPWPPIRWVPNNVLIQYKTGFGDTATTVPEAIKTEIRIRTKWLYEGSSGCEPSLSSVDYFRYLL